MIIIATHAGEELVGLLAAGTAGFSYALLVARIRIERLRGRLRRR